MKRSRELAPLSREHHVALELALALRRTDEADVEQTTARYLQFFAGDGAAHFRTEEDVLVPILPDELANRLLDEHAEIRAASHALEDCTGVLAARCLGQQLAAHVRFEERIVFAHLEEELAPAELAGIGRRLAAG